MKKIAPSLKPTSSPDSFQKHLPMYALAASAAGVGMLALAQAAEAEIVYTPADQNIRGTYDLDLTGDGTTDFALYVVNHSSSSVHFGAAVVVPAQTGNGVVGGERYAAALKRGYPIGPSGDFLSVSGLLVQASAETTFPKFKHCYGSWKDKQNHYLGLKFMISGEVHYGWARLSVECHDGNVAASLSGYAYETVPNQGLEAGQTKEKKEELENDNLHGPGGPASLGSPLAPVRSAATLGMLAGGARAIDLWRQE
jgi:hypothetical protein